MPHKRENAIIALNDMACNLGYPCPYHGLKSTNLGGFFFCMNTLNNKLLIYIYIIRKDTWLGKKIFKIMERFNQHTIRNKQLKEILF